MVLDTKNQPCGNNRREPLLRLVIPWMQMMIALLVVVLALFPCVSDATMCYVSSKRNNHECWKWVLDDPSAPICDTIGIGGLSSGVISCTDIYHKSPALFLVGQSAQNICPDETLTTSPGTSTATRPSDDGTSTADSSTPHEEQISSALPPPAYSEVCGRSYVYGTTDLNYWFRYLEIPPSLFQPKLTVEFEVKASQDVHVALAPSTESTHELYQVVIGGSGNSAAFLKRAMFATRLVTVNMNKPLNETVFRGFWITYNVTSGHIAVGKHNKENHFVEWTDPTPLNVSYVGFATSSNSEGEWRFCDF